MRHNSTYIPLAGSIFALTAVLALAACNNSGSKDGTDTKPSPEGTLAPTATPQLDPDNPNGPGTLPSPTPTVAGPGGPSITPVPAVTATPNATVPGDELKAFEFNYEGVPGPIKGNVSNNAIMKLLNWPEALTPKIHLTEPANQTRLTANFCDMMRTNAEAGRSEVVRARYGYNLFIEVLAPAGINFNNAAVHAAAVALAGPGAPRFEVKPQLLTAKPRVMLMEGAITAITGDLPKLEEELGTRLALNTQGAWVQGEMFASDLMCDLKSGKAVVEYDVTTSTGYQPAVVASEVVNSR